MDRTVDRYPQIFRAGQPVTVTEGRNTTFVRANCTVISQERRGVRVRVDDITIGYQTETLMVGRETLVDNDAFTIRHGHTKPTKP